MEQKILNLTQHVATPEQIIDGVFEPTEDDKLEIQKLLTFDEIPTRGILSDRADELTSIALKYAIPGLIRDFKYTDEDSPDEYCLTVMIGGAPYLMGFLEHYLANRNICAKYSFSKRDSVDKPQPDGSVKKVAVFKHSGFVEV